MYINLPHCSLERFYSLVVKNPDLMEPFNEKYCEYAQDCLNLNKLVI